MSVEDMDTVIRLWETERITLEQVIGKILVMLLEQRKQLSKLQARLSRLEARLSKLEANSKGGR